MSSSTMSTSNASEGGSDYKPTKKKINRLTASCEPCRRRKTRCNRLSPCEACTVRGQTCTWIHAKPLSTLSRSILHSPPISANSHPPPPSVSSTPSASIAKGDSSNSSMASGHITINSLDLQSQIDRLEALANKLQGITDVASNSLSSSNHSFSSNSPRFPSPNLNHEIFNGSSSSIHPPASSILTGTTTNGTTPTMTNTHRTNGDISGKPESWIDVQGDDLCEALAHLAVSHVQVIRPRLGIVKMCPLLDEATILSQTLPQQFGLDQSFNFNFTPSFTGFSHTNDSKDERHIQAVKELCGKIPDEKAAGVAADFYSRYVDCFFHPLHLPSFVSKANHLRSLIKESQFEKVDLFCLATYLSVCSLGLDSMSEERAVKKGFGPGSKDNQSRTWLSLALQALTLGKFFEHPEFEALRALFLISSYFICQSDGNSSSTGLKTLNLTLQLAFDLGLDRDPDDHSPGPNEEPLSTLEKEERRRFIHTALAFQSIFTGTLGRTASQAMSNQVITCRLPRDCNDDDLYHLPEETEGSGEIQRKDSNESTGSSVSQRNGSGKQREMENGAAQPKKDRQETAMTSILERIKLGEISRKISNEFLVPGRVSLSTIMRLDSELREFNSNLLSMYQINFDNIDVHFPSTNSFQTNIRATLLHAALWTEFLRLHRFSLLRGLLDRDYHKIGCNGKAQESVGTGDYSRKTCVEAARILLSIHRKPAMRAIWAGMQYQGFNAAIVLAVDTLCHPEDPQSTLHLLEVKKARDLMVPYIKKSIMLNKAVRILDLLISKIEKIKTLRERKMHKRGRLIDGSYDDLLNNINFGEIMDDVEAINGSNENRGVVEDEELPRKRSSIGSGSSGSGHSNASSTQTTHPHAQSQQRIHQGPATTHHSPDDTTPEIKMELAADTPHHLADRPRLSRHDEYLGFGSTPSTSSSVGLQSSDSSTSHQPSPAFSPPFKDFSFEFQMSPQNMRGGFANGANSINGSANIRRMSSLQSHSSSQGDDIKPSFSIQSFLPSEGSSLGNNTRSYHNYYPVPSTGTKHQVNNEFRDSPLYHHLEESFDDFGNLIPSQSGYVGATLLAAIQGQDENLDWLRDLA